MKSFTVDKYNEGQRLNKYCLRILTNAPSSFIYKMLRKKNITLNSKKADGSELLKTGDEVKFFLSDETFDKFSGNNKSFENNSFTENGIDNNQSDLNIDNTKFNNKTINNSIFNNNDNSINTINNKNVKKDNYYKGIDLNKINPVTSEDILFENEDILIVYKKAGELSQKAEPGDVSINERILKYCLETLDKTNVNFTPGVCNRLDRNTQGLITAGKTLRGSRLLSDLFKTRQIDKYYLAVVKGNFNKKIDQKIYLSKDNSSNIVSISEVKIPDSSEIHNIFYPVFSSNNCSVVKIKLETGKSHQIRAHLSYLGYPIIGDKKYFNSEDELSKKYHLRGQLLLAYELVFPRLENDFKEISDLNIKCDLPKEFVKLFEGEKLWPYGTQEGLEVHF